MEKLSICIIGGGNSTHLLAPLCVLKGHKVSILTRQPQKWNSSKEISFLNSDQAYLGGKQEIKARVDTISSDPATCVADADMLVFAGLPSDLVTEKLNEILPFTTKKRLFIGSICAYGGFNWQVWKSVTQLKLKGIQIVNFGFQAIPWSCGTKQYGSIGLCYGHKYTIKMCCEHSPLTSLEKELHQTLADILEIPLNRWEYMSFLAATLYPNNPVFHPPIEYGLFKDWDMKSSFVLGEEVPVFIYKEVSKVSANYMTEINDEVKLIVNELKKVSDADVDLFNPGFDLLESLRIAFGTKISDYSSVYTALRSNEAYFKYKNPYIVTKEEGGKTYVQPNLNHRFYKCDLTVGLVTYKDIANLVNVTETPLLNNLIKWNQKLVGKQYMTENNELKGKDIDECLLPSKLGYTKETLHKNIFSPNSNL